MAIDLQLTAIDTDPHSVNFSGTDYVALMRDLQGNILKPHGRDASAHIFLAFEPDRMPAVRAWLARTLAPRLTTADGQRAQTARFKAGQGSEPFIGAGLSAQGYLALGFTEDQLPQDPSFRRGAKHPDTQAPLGLNDPPVAQWDAGFQQDLHLLLIVADDDSGVVQATVAGLLAGLNGIARVVVGETGAVFRDPQGRVIEHFGFADGISQPLFLARDIEAARMNGGLDRYDPSAPLGLALVKDALAGQDGYGSYLVFRKLRQDVAGFRAAEAKLAQTIGLGEDPAGLAGALVVGRFRDGTPVTVQPLPGWTNEPNNFNYDHDADGMRCPFQAHTRKTNPRGDKSREFGLPMGEDRSRRIARRAVSYGPLVLDPPPGSEVGLLFMSVQASVADQFEFMQAIWSNFTDFLRPGTGLDPVIGQGVASAPAVPQPWPRSWGVHAAGCVAFDFATWVQMRGGEYFFLPAPSFFAGLDAPSTTATGSSA